MLTTQDIGELLKEMRLDRDMTQDDLATKVGLSRYSICKLEKGTAGLGAINTLRDIAEACGYDVFVKFERRENV